MKTSFKSKSYSDSELVLNYQDTLALLDYYSPSISQRVTGWEGWILYSDGTLGHSLQHQGTADLSDQTAMAALTIIQDTITQSYQEWQVTPEVEQAELLFCIITD